MTKRIICVLLSIIICLSFVACQGSEASYEEKTFFVMDTLFTLKIYGDDEGTAEHFAAVLSLLNEIEEALSRTKEESDVSRINRDRTAADLSPHTVAVLKIALEVGELTDGAYLPTMGAVTDLWQTAEKENALPGEAALSAALADAALGFTLKDGVCTLLGDTALLDLGGIGKGYAADCVLEYLEEKELRGALLSFGSSVATVGEKGNGKPFTVSLRHPRDSAKTVGTLKDPKGVLSVSGDYERYVTVNGTRYHHILDPESGYPADKGIASVAVLCESGAYSDALSTAFMVMGEERAKAVLESLDFTAHAVFVEESGAYRVTDGLDFE